MHSANFSQEPSGKRGSATCWSLEVVPSGLDRLKENGNSPNFRVIPMEHHFPGPMIFLFRWSPQLQLTYATRIVAGFERLQLSHRSSPRETAGQRYSWTVEQQLLDLDGSLVQTFRTAALAVDGETQARAVLARHD
jgi:hypothetical protein